MSLNKAAIESHFNRASLSYESVSYIQKACANLLKELWRTFSPHYVPNTILDLGTGTGYMIENLFPLYQNSHYTLNDIAHQMLLQVQEKRLGNPKQFSFWVGDMEKMPFKLYDLIVSNFAFQWAFNLNILLKKCYFHSHHFAFSTLLSGTFQEWNTLLKSHDIPPLGLNYPSCADLENQILKLNPKKYHFLVKDFKVTFDNAKAFLRYLKELGAGISKTTLCFKKRVRLYTLIKNHTQSFTVTYQVFFAILKRE